MARGQAKRAWVAPAVRPITEPGGRADERDVPVQNIIGPSQITN